MEFSFRRGPTSRRSVARYALSAVLLACGSVRDSSDTSRNAGGSDASSVSRTSDAASEASGLDGARARDGSLLPDPSPSFLFSFDGQLVALQGTLRVESVAMGPNEMALRMSGFLEGPSIQSSGIPAAFSVTVTPRAAGAGACGSEVTVTLEIPEINQPIRYGTTFSGAYCEKGIDRAISTGFSTGTAFGKLITADGTAAAVFSVEWAQKVPPP